MILPWFAFGFAGWSNVRLVVCGDVVNVHADILNVGAVGGFVKLNVIAGCEEMTRYKVVFIV